MLADLAVTGKPVRFRYGPAAVIGDECRTKPLWRRRREDGSQKSDGEETQASDETERVFPTSEFRLPIFDGKARRVGRSESQKT